MFRIVGIRTLLKAFRVAWWSLIADQVGNILQNTGSIGCPFKFFPPGTTHLHCPHTWIELWLKCLSFIYQYVSPVLRKYVCFGWPHWHLFCSNTKCTFQLPEHFKNFSYYNVSHFSCVRILIIKIGYKIILHFLISKYRWLEVGMCHSSIANNRNDEEIVWQSVLFIFPKYTFRLVSSIAFVF